MELGMGVEDTDGKTGWVNFPCRASLVLRSVQYSTVQYRTVHPSTDVVYTVLSIYGRSRR